jgi:hypothetical protein
MQRPFRLRRAYGATGRLGVATMPGEPVTFHLSLFTVFSLGPWREIFSVLSVVTQTGRRMDNRIRSYPKLPISARNR